MWKVTTAQFAVFEGADLRYKCFSGYYWKYNQNN